MKRFIQTASLAVTILALGVSGTRVLTRVKTTTQGQVSTSQASGDQTNSCTADGQCTPCSLKCAHTGNATWSAVEETGTSFTRVGANYKETIDLLQKQIETLLPNAFEPENTPGFLVVTYRENEFHVTNTTKSEAYNYYNSLEDKESKVLIDNIGYIKAAFASGAGDQYKLALVGYAANYDLLDASFYDGGWAIATEHYDLFGSALPEPTLKTYDISTDAITTDFLNKPITDGAQALVAMGFVLDSRGSSPYKEIAIGKYFSRFLGADAPSASFF